MRRGTRRFLRSLRAPTKNGLVLVLDVGRCLLWPFLVCTLDAWRDENTDCPTSCDLVMAKQFFVNASTLREIYAIAVRPAPITDRNGRGSLTRSLMSFFCLLLLDSIVIVSDATPTRDSSSITSVIDTRAVDQFNNQLIHLSTNRSIDH